MFTSHLHSILFHDYTSVKEVDAPNIPLCVHNFTPFEDILSRSLDEAFAYDVIGQVVGYTGELRSNHGKQTRRCELELRDDRNKHLKCVLWGSYVDEACGYLTNHASGPVVIILMMGKVKEFSGRMQIGTSFNSSKLFMNPDIPEKVNFLKSVYVDTKPEVTQVAQINVSSNINSEEYFTRPRFYMGIHGLKSLTKASRVMIKGKISYFDTSRGWWYLGCVKCGKKIENVEDGKPCPLCKGESAAEVERKFRLQVQVVDNSGSATFTLFDKETSKLIGVSVKKPYSDMIQGGDPEAFLEELDAVIDKEFPFLVKVMNYNFKYKNSPFTISAVKERVHLLTDALEKELDAMTESQPIPSVDLTSDSQPVQLTTPQGIGEVGDIGEGSQLEGILSQSKLMATSANSNERTECSAVNMATLKRTYSCRRDSSSMNSKKKSKKNVQVTKLDLTTSLCDD